MRNRTAFALLFALTVAMIMLMPAIAQLAPGNTTPAAVMRVQQSETIAQAPTTPTDKLPNVVILATGGTIAGTGATSTTTAGYQAAKLPVTALTAVIR